MLGSPRVVLFAYRHVWSAAALFCACVLLFSIRQPLVQNSERNRRRFTRSSIIQTAIVFFLITTALTPFLQRAYGLRALAHLLALTPTPKASAGVQRDPGSAYSGVILTLPPKPHQRFEPPSRSEHTGPSGALKKVLVIPFDGVYWYFKAPDTRPKSNARTQRGDPLKASIRSTDYRALAMEAHQTLSSYLSADCCRALRVDLINADNRLGAIQLELILRDTSGKSHSLSLGSLPIPSSQLQKIPFNRPPVHESLNFQLPVTANGEQFDEITVIIKPSRERSLAGSQIAIQNFTLIP